MLLALKDPLEMRKLSLADRLLQLLGREDLSCLRT